MAVSPTLSAPYFQYNLKGGVRTLAQSPNGKVIACGARGGAVALFADRELITDFDVKPIKNKNKSEAELQLIVMSNTGDITYCATSVDVLAINSNTGDIAWQYQQRRQWGFLSSIPQGAYLTENEDLTVAYSSGEMTILDRKARILATDNFHSAPRFLVTNPNSQLVYGSDGYRVYSWDRHNLTNSVTQMANLRCYTLALSGDNSTLVARADSKLVCIDTKSNEVKFEFEVTPGLPSIAIDHEGSDIAHLVQNQVLLRSLDGSVNREINFGEDFPLSLLALKSGSGFLIGMRSGLVYFESWS